MPRRTIFGALVALLPLLCIACPSEEAKTTPAELIAEMLEDLERDLDRQHSNGKKAYEGTARGAGVLVGVHRAWYKTGQLAMEAEYDAGVLKSWTTYKPDGSVGSKSTNGTGIFTLYHEDGVRKEEVAHQDGVKHGKEQVWAPSGTLQRVRPFQEGRLEGTETQYHEDGKTVKRTVPWVTPQAGWERTSWTIGVGGSVKHGVELTYSNAGILRNERTWRQGESIALRVFRGGTLAVEETSEPDKPRVHRIFRRDGKTLAYQRTWGQSLRMVRVVTYRPDGSVADTVEGTGEATYYRDDGTARCREHYTSQRRDRLVTLRPDGKTVAWDVRYEPRGLKVRELSTFKPDGSPAGRVEGGAGEARFYEDDGALSREVRYEDGYATHKVRFSKGGQPLWIEEDAHGFDTKKTWLRKTTGEPYLTVWYWDIQKVSGWLSLKPDGSVGSEHPARAGEVATGDLTVYDEAGAVSHRIELVDGTGHNPFVLEMVASDEPW